MSDAMVADAPEGRSVLSAVSSAMVRLYKHQFGRGPTKARADFAGPDLLICTLEDSFTLAERNLLAIGESQRLWDVRMCFQHASGPAFRESIEQITGRKVVASVSGVDVGRDLSLEAFYLEPVRGPSDDGPDLRAA